MRLVAAVVLTALASSVAAAQGAARSSAQGAARVATEANPLVVRLHVLHADGTRENGAGVIVAASPGVVHVLTARHVVAKEIAVDDSASTFDPAVSVWAAFFSAADSLPASVMLLDSAYLAPVRERLAAALRAGDSTVTARSRLSLAQDSVLIMGYDLAVVSVNLGTKTPASGWSAPILDRLGDPHAMETGDDVTAIGCPRGACWVPSGQADKFILAQPGELVLQTISVAPGSSGGGLFNSDGEVIGIVRDTRVPRASAVPIDEAVRILTRAGVPVQLRRARFPRAGYHTHVELTLLSASATASAPDSLAGIAQLPSARLTISRRGRSPLTWHASALHLAPYNTRVLAALGGVGYTLRWRRLSAFPFAELGLGSVDARFDRGGYHTVGQSGAQGTYVPLWTASPISGVGVGGGASLAYFVAPRWSISMSVARWSFGLPPNAPTFPRFFVGGGLRWSQ